MKRSELVPLVAAKLSEYTNPRLHLILVLCIAGGAAFLCSALLLWSGMPAFESMAIRYAVAALAGYLAFVGLIRLWISLHRPGDESWWDIDLIDGADLVRAFGGGPSVPAPAVTGDGSALDALERERPDHNAVRREVREPTDGWGWDLDLDDGWIWICVAAVCAVGGVLAVAYVISIAPILLAEVALDAAIISTLYRRLRADEQGHWLTTVVTRTWLAAAVIIVFAALGGFALNLWTPDSRSIGDVVRRF
jgi:hypothetical protein